MYDRQFWRWLIELACCYLYDICCCAKIQKFQIIYWEARERKLSSKSFTFKLPGKRENSEKEQFGDKSRLNCTHYGINNLTLCSGRKPSVKYLRNSTHAFISSFLLVLWFILSLCFLKDTLFHKLSPKSFFIQIRNSPKKICCNVSMTRFKSSDDKLCCCFFKT